MTRTLLLTAAAIVLLGITAAASISIGARTLIDGPNLAATWNALLHPAPGDTLAPIVAARANRTSNALFAGAALAMAGAAMQGLTRNGLAEPGLLGINSGAALAVVLGIYLGGVDNGLGQAALALVGALATAAIVYAIGGRGSRSGGGFGALTLVLAGAAITAGSASLVSAITISSQDLLDSFRMWQVGNITRAGSDNLLTLLPLLIVGALCVLGGATTINALALGEDVAVGLGMNPGRRRAIIITGIALMCAATVALVGPIAFVGLVVPHIVRRLVGADYRIVLPLCAILGPVVVLAADIVGRIILPPGEVPVGVMMAFVGAPFFLILLRSTTGGAA